MSQTPLNLLHFLQRSSWRHLLALMGAHSLSSSTRQAKELLIAQLQRHLLERAVLTQILTQLDTVGKDLLRALLAADGALPVYTVEQRFGPVRPYRPWQQAAADTPKQPWLTPISATETLWYFGLIFRHPPKPTPGQVQHYVIPADLIPPLTTLLRQPAATVPTTTLPQPGHHGPLAHHLAIWLATVHAPHPGPPYQSQAVKPVHQRWLPPSVVTLLCQRLGLD